MDIYSFTHVIEKTSNNFLFRRHPIFWNFFLIPWCKRTKGEMKREAVMRENNRNVQTDRMKNLIKLSVILFYLADNGIENKKKKKSRTALLT